MLLFLIDGPCRSGEWEDQVTLQAAADKVICLDIMFIYSSGSFSLLPSYYAF